MVCISGNINDDHDNNSTVMTMMMTVSTTIVILVLMIMTVAAQRVTKVREGQRQEMDKGKGGSKAREGHQQKKDNGRPHAIEVVTNRQAMLVAAVVGGSACGGVEDGAPRGGVNRMLSRCPYRRKLGFHLLPPLIQPAFLCVFDAMHGAQVSRQLRERKDAGMAGTVYLVGPRQCKG